MKDPDYTQRGPTRSEHTLHLRSMRLRADESDVLSRYTELLEEWRTGRPTQACEKGQWEDEYTRMHGEMMRGEREPSLLEFSCKSEYCGGIADR